MSERQEAEMRQAHRGAVKVGVVVSTAMKDTATVRVVTPRQHPRYLRIVRRTKRFTVHDPGNKCNAGDRVEIRECRPLSKKKRWRLVRTVHNAEAAKVGRPSAGGKTQS